MKKLYLIATVFMGVFLFTTPNLVSTLGINAYAAKKVIDIISAAGSVYAIVGIVAAVVGGGGIGVGILVTAKSLVNKFGKKWAAAW